MANGKTLCKPLKLPKDKLLEMLTLQNCVRSVTKNELMRNTIQACVNNRLKFRFILMDSWFAAVENFEFIDKHKKEFIAALKDNRLFAPSLEDKYQGRFKRVSEIALSDKRSVRGYLKGYDKEVLLVRLIFTNKDKSTGELTLVCSDTTLDGDFISTIYQKRWKVEEFHKSLKSNASLAKSPTKTVKTQANHIFMSPPHNPSVLVRLVYFRLV